jgi:RimJ/RimL family protein N-acetyltransferase
MVVAYLAPKNFFSKKNLPLIVRSLGGEDAQEMLSFFKALGEESTHTLQYAGKPLKDEQFFVERFDRAKDDPAALNLGIFDQEKMVGWLNFQGAHILHPWIKHIGHFGMGVRRAYWGQGLGSKLLETMNEFVDNSGFLRVEANVRVENVRGVALYKRFGYEIEGTRRAAAFINGRFVDEYFIARVKI